MPNSPVGVKGRHIDEVDGLGNIADGLIECRAMQNNEIDTKSSKPKWPSVPDNEDTSAMKEHIRTAKRADRIPEHVNQKNRGWD